ncbi:MAG: LacI family DNA-binding transcriptional regulator [Calditrichia bacterium]
MVTIKDVAKKANVSVATVSLVIHNHKRISQETRKRVLKVIDELGYHPSHSARGLVSRRSGNIGFITTNDHFSRSEPFYTQIFLGTEFRARDLEYYVLLTTIPSDFSENDPLPRFVLEHNVDGVIIAGKVPANLVERLEEKNLPIIFVDYYLEGHRQPAVMIDNVDGGRQATRHLLDCGHRDIAFIGGDIGHPSISERYQGYRQALEEAAVPFSPGRCVLDAPYPDREGGYRSIKKLLESGEAFSAVFSCNDAMAIGALQGLREAGLRVPQDVSIIGFDDVEADLSLDPPLSTMRVPKVDLGIEAVNLVVNELKSPGQPFRKILVPAELVVRGSTCYKPENAVSHNKSYTQPNKRR